MLLKLKVQIAYFVKQLNLYYIKFLNINGNIFEFLVFISLAISLFITEYLFF
jgi:hypothetical protein